jgi:bacterioferritin-associated ferredoxin
MYVCICHGVTDRAIREAAAAGARELGDLAVMTGLGTGCGSCTDIAASLLVEVRRERSFPLPVFAIPIAA